METATGIIGLRAVELPAARALPTVGPAPTTPINPIAVITANPVAVITAVTAPATGVREDTSKDAAKAELETPGGATANRIAVEGEGTNV